MTHSKTAQSTIFHQLATQEETSVTPMNSFTTELTPHLIRQPRQKTFKNTTTVYQIGIAYHQKSQQFLSLYLLKLGSDMLAKVGR